MPSDMCLAELMDFTEEEWRTHCAKPFAAKFGAGKLMQMTIEESKPQLAASGMKVPRLLHISDFYDETSDPSHPLAGGLLAANKLAVFIGDPKGGKGLCAIEILHSVAEGNMVMGEFESLKLTENECVMYFCMEDGDEEIKLRLQKRGAGRDLPIYICYESFDMNSSEGWGIFETLIAGCGKKPRLIILDTIRRAFASTKDWNAPEEVGRNMSKLCDWAHEQKCAIIAIHHTNKNPNSVGSNRASGSNAVVSNADSVITLSKKSDREQGFLTWELDAEGRGGIGGRWRIKGDMSDYTIRVMDENESKEAEEAEKAEYIKQLQGQIIELIRSRHSIVNADLQKAFGLSQPTASRRLAEMLKSGLVRDISTNKKNKVYALALED